MRLIELEIENVRGIRHLILQPQGANFAVWGPNGSGKSAVVDAVDFLLTGGITRLTGKGTGNISLAKHGPHIDCKPADAKVRAVILLKGNDKPIEIARCMEHPKTVICDDADKALLEPILKLAERGHHVLTRREILRFITSEGSTRAQDIQELLNISEIEKIRKALISVQNGLSKELLAARQGLRAAEGAVSATLSLPIYLPDAALQKVNQHRAVFGKPPLNELGSQIIKKDLQLPPATSGNQAINVTVVQSDIDNLRQNLGAKHQSEIATSNTILQKLLGDIQKDPRLVRTLSLYQLISLGIGLIDETGACPLCETAWPTGELQKLLESRLSMADQAQQMTAEVEKLTASISAPIASSLASLGIVIAIVAQMDQKDQLDILEKWQKDLQDLLETMSSPLGKYPDDRFMPEHVVRLMAPQDIDKTLEKIILDIKSKFPAATPEQTAWDTLTRLEENLKALEAAQQQLEKCNLYVLRAGTLIGKFEQARNDELGTLYNEISDRFVKLYASLHEEDEKSFTAVIKPDEAALDFEVDFYGRGIHPPHALHSEGHQDSMGLCLYLALAERLTGGLLDLIILDDVVMSVDADHRRKLCNLLIKEFPHRQFLITTHDKTWSSQLKTEGVVNTKSMIEFYNWTVDSGPQVNAEADLWNKIGKDLEKNDVSAASAALRHGSEEYFSMACDALQAPVKFKLNGRWELGDLLPAAMMQYRYLLKLAKKSANSWNQKERLAELDEINDIASKIFTRSNTEQWAVNATVHYNNWASFTKPDFIPVVEAFQDLFGVFRCNKCESILSITLSGIDPANLRCLCGEVNWNLVGKKTE
jgi:energy-coupling factor transporter ATP-binding protein EcfA2